MAGFFDRKFDFNHDGKLSGFERAARSATIAHLIAGGAGDVESAPDTEDDDLMFDLELAGLDADELELMDEEERNELLEDAGLDPDDYDF